MYTDTTLALEFVTAEIEPLKFDLSKKNDSAKFEAKVYTDHTLTSKLVPMEI